MRTLALQSMPKPLFAFMLLTIVFGGGLSGCSETRYAAHMVKQIPMGQDKAAKSVGYFKVGSPYNIKGRKYYPKETYGGVETGTASWYGPGFHGKMTANGETFDRNDLTAAHRTLQIPSVIKVTNLSNGRSIILRVNDRGPFAHDRVLDVSERAASLLGFKNQGTAKVRIEVMTDASKVVANAAKQGKDTRGYAVALNQNKTHHLDQPSIITPPPTPEVKMASAQSVQNAQRVAQVQPATGAPQQIYYKPEPVQRVVLSPEMPTQTSPAPVEKVVNNVVDNQKVSKFVPSVPAGKIFVQAGAFSEEQNALAFSRTLSSYGPSKVYMTRVDNKPFYRVRLGPYEDSAKASEAVLALNNSGKANAVLIVD